MDGQFDVVVGYAPSSRATCNLCGKKIDRGEMRITKKTRSDYHDGFDTKWNHAICTMKKPYETIQSIRGYETLRYGDTLELAKLRPALFPGIDTEIAAERKKYIEQSMELWDFIDQLEVNVKAAQLKVTIEENGFFADKLDLYDQLYFMGLGLFRGLIGPCPLCNGFNLVPFRDTVRCRGFLSHTKCTNVGKLEDFQERYKWNLNADLKKNALLKDWEHPDPSIPKNFKSRSSGGGGGASTSKDAQEEEEEEAFEYRMPEEGNECEGMTVCFSGDISAEIKEFVTERGGATSKSVVKATTHVVVESEDQKETKIVKDALKKGIPVVGIQFLLDLLGMEPHVEDEETKKKAEEEKAKKRAEEEEAKRKAEEEEAKRKAEEEEEAKKRAEAAGNGRTTRRRAAAAASDKLTSSKEEPRKVTRGRGRVKAEEAAEEEEKPEYKKTKPSRVELRLPEKLKESGLLMFDSEPGDAHLQQIKKRKAGEQEGGEAKKQKKPPKPGCELLKVDPDSGYASKGEILLTDDGLDAYNCTMNNVDLGSGKNRFYIIQIIHSGKQYILYKKWGRVGESGPTNGDKTEKFGKKDSAVSAFDEKFFECTGCRWENRDNFQNRPGRYSIVALDSGNDEEMGEAQGGDDEQESEALKKATVEASKLNERQKNLIELIFNSKEMENTMRQMDIDTKKMPLGKLSKVTILEAYKVLKTIEGLLAENNNPNKGAHLLNATTQFYTLIPHYFANGVLPPIIDSNIKLQNKVTMLESLMDLEIAGKLMGKKQIPSKDGTIKDQLDAHYDSLDAEILPLDKQCDTYKNLVKYATRDYPKLEVLDIFTVERKGELERFKPWKDADNRQLLWHGSRLTNWVGIISQGLRIAPPEAPVSGYLFGKGVYFANLISKSANYCRADRTNPTALLSLSEVALGKMYEVTRPEYMEKPKPAFDSTKALGKMHPDPHENYVLDTGSILPFGKVKNDSSRSTMGHDELIVYDVSQIMCRYLLKVKLPY